MNKVLILSGKVASEHNMTEMNRDLKIMLEATGDFDDIDAYRVPGWPPKHHPVDVPDGKLEHMRGVNTDTPIAWMHHYGNGRVFGCSIGHGIDTFRRFDYITMFVRACQWCCGKEVTLEKPDRTGENRFRPWPYY
ncbi:ThuA domain-containing protein [Bilifractor sp. HCP3S3_D3]|uniref:ThuA domain-containing protein n=1 Tax=unclassified Bilifractor TaxID=2815795 RepID=UPI003F8B6911